MKGPCNLLALGYTGFAHLTVVPKCLGNPGPVKLVPQRLYTPFAYTKLLSTPPLTQEESRRAAAAKFWIIRYQDQFLSGDAPDSYPVAVCLSQAEAAAELVRRGPLVIGWDGHVAEGPGPLAQPTEPTTPLDAEVIREALRRLAAGQAGPVSARSDAREGRIGWWLAKMAKRASPGGEPSGLHWLEKDLEEGRRPPEEKLRRSVVEEFIAPASGPGNSRYELCAIAAALLGDLEVWRRSVRAETGREHDGYRRQRGMGVPKSEIGDIPSYPMIAEKLRRSVQGTIRGGKPDLAAEILERLSGFAEADRHANYE